MKIKSLCENMALLNEDNLKKNELIKDLQMEKNNMSAYDVNATAKSQLAPQAYLETNENYFDQTTNYKSPIKLIKVSQWNIPPDNIVRSREIQMCATREPQLLAYHMEISGDGSTWHMIKVNDMRGREISKIYKRCSQKSLLTPGQIISITHKGRCLIAANCTACEKIKVFDSALSIITEIDILASGICPGPNGSIVYADAISDNLKIVKILSTSSQEHAKSQKSILQYSRAFWWSEPEMICYDAKTDVVFIVHQNREGVTAYSRNSGEDSHAFPYSESWVLSSEIYGLQLHIKGICTDNLGLVYLVDGTNDRITILESTTGRVVPIEQPEMLGISQLHDVTYCEGNETLILRHGDDIITCYKVPIIASGQNEMAAAQSPSCAVDNESFVKYDYVQDQYIASGQKFNTWPVRLQYRGSSHV